MKTFSKAFGKAAVAFSLVGLLSSVAMADSIDDEIAKLKKENELLELKKKNAKLQKGSVEFSNVVETDDEDYRSSLNGFFVGAEVGYSPSVNNTLRIVYDEAAISTNSYQTTYALPISLAFGYQIYPWQNAGFKFKGYVGYANYNSPFKASVTNQGETITYDGDQKSSAIHYGLEAEYLYDFIASQTHTFGLNIGIGYEFGTFIGQELNATMTTPDGQSPQNNKFNGYTISSFTSSAGVHYYYNINHQFELKYRYASGYTTEQTQKEENASFKYSTLPAGSIIFAYNYKF